MDEWVADTGDHVVVEETGLYIEGEYLPDTPTEGHDHE